MTSGRNCEFAARRSRAICCASLGLLVLATGCSSMQKSWSPRFGELRRLVEPEHPPLAGTPQVAADPYASRLDLGPPGDWTPVAGEADAPVTGAVRLAAPAGAVPGPVASIPAPTPVAEDPATMPGQAPSTSLVSTETPAPPAEEADAPLDELEAIDRVMDRGIERLAALRNYRVTLDRQERVRETLQPAEQVLLNVRTEPFAVRLEWPDGPNKGREVLYSETECRGLMHVKLGKTLIPVPPMQLDPNSPLALANSRHPITEAGLTHILTQTKEQVDLARRGDPSIGEFRILGPHVPEDFDAECVEVVRDTPNGEFWRLVVDQDSGLPLLLEATAGGDHLLERYHFRNIETDLAELESEGAFDPATRFGRPMALPVDRLATARPD